MLRNQLRAMLPALVALIGAAVVSFLGWTASSGPYGELTVTSLAIFVFSFVAILFLSLLVFRPKGPLPVEILGAEGKPDQLATHTFTKYRSHLESARSSLNILLALTIACLVIIVFARYFLVVDQVWSGQAVNSSTLNSPYCEALADYSQRSVLQDASGVPNARYDEYVKACDVARSEMRSTQDAAPDTSGDVETEAFWPVLLLRASVLAFMLFIMWFFIRNYQYETAIANRYFAIFSGLLSDQSRTALVNGTRSAFDTGDIKFGAVRSEGIMDIVSLPRVFIEALMERVGAKQPEPRELTSEIADNTGPDVTIDAIPKPKRSGRA